MSKLLSSFEALRRALDAYAAAEEASGVPEQYKPSVLLLTYNPQDKPNGRSAIVGDPELVVEVLRMALHDPANEALREAMVNLVPDLLD